MSSTALVLVRRRFEDPAEALLKEVGPMRVAHVDCDIYSAVAYSYIVTKPHTVEGDYWVFDDARMGFSPSPA